LRDQALNFFDRPDATFFDIGQPAGQRFVQFLCVWFGLERELREHLDALWDKQFEQDVEAGRLDDMIARAREEHATGKTRPMDEIVRDE
jgi:hypothetical protein